VKKLGWKRYKIQVNSKVCFLCLFSFWLHLNDVEKLAYNVRALMQCWLDNVITRLSLATSLVMSTNERRKGLTLHFKWWLAYSLLTLNMAISFASSSALILAMILADCSNA
jgi:hypothetical protein